MKKKVAAYDGGKARHLTKDELEDFREGIEVSEIMARYWEAVRLFKKRKNKVEKMIEFIYGRKIK